MLTYITYYWEKLSAWLFKKDNEKVERKRYYIEPLLRA